MTRKKTRPQVPPHYYTIYQVNGAFRTRMAANFVHATEDLEDVAAQGGLPVAIYDVYDWFTHWQLPPGHDRAVYEADVLDITDALRQKHE